MRSVILLPFLLLGSLSHADVLFIDLNSNPKEIEAAERAAKRRGEKLIVIPKVDARKAKEFESARESVNQSQNRMVSACGTGSGASDACRSARRDFAERMRQQPKVELINKDILTKELKDLKDSGVKVSSMVVSGHDGNGHFTGVYGSLKDKEMQEAFAQAEPLGDNIRSMFLWGCYTTNIGSVMNNWKKSFPQAELVVGYDGSAPLGDKPANWRYLEDAMVKEKQLTSVKDARALQKAMGQIDGVNLVNASICVEDTYASKKHAMNLRDAESLCKKIIEETRELYTCYLNAEPRCENPPQNTSSSELRSLYNKLQDGKHCLEVNSARGVQGTPSADIALRLIFYKNIKENFVRNDPGFLKEVNEMLKQSGAPDSLQWGDLRSMTRAEVLKKLNAMNDYLTAQLKDPRPDAPELMTIQAAHRKLQRVLGDVNVDFNWVEPGLVTDMISKWTGKAQATTASNRNIYETQRATAALEKMADEVRAKDPERFKEYKKLLENYNEESKKVYSDNNVNAESSKKLFEKYNEMQKKRQDLYPNLKETLKASAGSLKDQPYPHEEGKKIFDQAVDDILKSKRPIGGFGEMRALESVMSGNMGMGFGMGFGIME